MARNGAVPGRKTPTNLPGGGRNERGRNRPAGGTSGGIESSFGGIAGGWLAMLCTAIFLSTSHLAGAVELSGGTGGAGGVGANVDGVVQKVQVASAQVATGVSVKKASDSQKSRGNLISIPEPGTLILMVTGVLAITSRQRKPNTN